LLISKWPEKRLAYVPLILATEKPELVVAPLLLSHPLAASASNRPIIIRASIGPPSSHWPDFAGH